MKRNKIYIVIVLAGLISIASVASYSETTDTPVALIKKIVQDVSYKSKDMDDWESAKVGIPLNDGEEIKTGFKSLALVLFTDGSGILRVRENSILHIYGEKKEKTLDKNTFIEQGKLSFEVNKQEEDEEFKFTTPTVVASIRGTTGLIKVTTGSTNFYLEKGMAFLQATMGAQQSGTIGANQAVLVDSTGSLDIIKATQQTMDEFSASLQTETKKVLIETDSYKLEIEYFPPE
ncbi:FecR domain-containing protein [Bacteroidota bacterium]